MTDPRLVSWFRSSSRTATLLVTLVGVLGVLGWTLNIGLMKSIVPGMEAMKANTSIGLILAGVALWFLGKEKCERLPRRAAQVCAFLTVLVAALTLGEYLFGWNLGIDQMLFRESLREAGGLYPGRMSAFSAFCLALTSLAMLVLDVETRKGWRPAQLLSFAVALLSFLALLDYLLVPSISYMHTALNASLAFFVFSMAVLGARPDRGLVAVMASNSSGGKMARRLLPAAILIPTALGWFRLAGQQAGLYNIELGTALVTVATSALIALLVWWNAQSMDRADDARKLAEERIRSLNAELARQVVEMDAANKELEAFTYSLSHDLRGPMSRIDGFGKILEETAGPRLDPASRDYLGRIRQAARQMGRMMQDMLKLAWAGHQELALQPTDLNSLVEEALAELKLEAVDRQVEWQIVKLPVVECDPALMKQVFVNLLSNALKFTRGRRRAVIEIGKLTQSGRPVVFVRDNGIGFKTEWASQLFSAFRRLHDRKDFEGTGIGLAIVHRVVQRHGGRIWAAGEPDRGATIYFTLGAAVSPAGQGPAPDHSSSDAVQPATH